MNSRLRTLRAVETAAGTSLGRNISQESLVPVLVGVHEDEVEGPVEEGHELVGISETVLTNSSARGLEALQGFLGAGTSST